MTDIYRIERERSRWVISIGETPTLVCDRRAVALMAVTAAYRRLVTTEEASASPSEEHEATGAEA
jgi:hypothetical protein